MAQTLSQRSILLRPNGSELREVRGMAHGRSAGRRAPQWYQNRGERNAPAPLPPAAHFVRSSRSISSMVEFISRIAALNGAEVVMSTPAPFSRSIGYREEPDASMAR